MLKFIYNLGYKFLEGVWLVADSAWLFVVDICSFGELSGVDDVVVMMFWCLQAVFSGVLVR